MVYDLGERKMMVNPFVVQRYRLQPNSIYGSGMKKTFVILIALAFIFCGCGDKRSKTSADNAAQAQQNTSAQLNGEEVEEVEENGADSEQAQAGEETPDSDEHAEENGHDDHDCAESDLVCVCAGKNCSEATKAFIAAICNRPDIAVAEIDRFISEGADINAPFKIGYEGESDSESNTRQPTRPIFHLVGDSLRHLVVKGANINVKDGSGNTVLMYSLTNNADSGLIKLLLEKKSAVNTTNDDGETPLLLAVKNRNEDHVRLLLENKANPNNGVITVEGHYNEKAALTLLEYAAYNGKIIIVQLLLKHGAKIKDTRAHLIAADRAKTFDHRGNELSDEQQKEVFWAIVKTLLSKGADVNAHDVNYPGNTLLFYAINQHNLNMVKYLVQHGADPMREDYTLLAWQNQHFPNGKEIKEFIYSLLEFSDKEDEEESGYLPIHAAIKKRDLKKVKEILKGDPAAAKAVDKNGHAPLHVLFYSYGCSSCVEVMSAAIFDMKQMATEDNMLPMLELLLKNGSDVNALNNNGKTPLHAAAQFGAPEKLIAVLLKNSADVNARDKFGKTPLHYANSAETVKILIKNGADVNAVSSGLNRTPLHTAAPGADWGVVEALLAAGADKHAKDKYGKTPYDLADYSEKIRGMLKL